MHPSVREWVSRASLPYQGQPANILEIGSYNVNGGLRDLFRGSAYVGADVRFGPGVDTVCRPGHVDLPDDWADLAICVNTLEHDEDPLATLRELARILRPGGLCLYNCIGPNWPRHDEPVDLWRFFPATARLLAEQAGLIVVSSEPDGPDPYSRNVVARKL